MNILASVISSGIGELIKSIADVVDRFMQTPDEKAKMQVELIRLAYEQQNKMMASADTYEGELTKRLQADTSSDSWLAKNIRPLALIALLSAYTFAAFGNDATLLGVSIHIAPLYEAGFRSFCEFALGFYFGGRSLEKIATTVSEAWKK